LADPDQARADEARRRGPGRVLIAVYGTFALAATARASYQLSTRFSEAPVAYLLSAFAGVLYVLATVALVRVGRTWWQVAVAAVSVELLGVLVVGTLSILDRAAFPDETVWSVFGRGYGFIPLILPILGLLWLHRTRPSAATEIRPGSSGSRRGGGGDRPGSPRRGPAPRPGKLP